MKIHCDCQNTIHDISDAHAYKGHVIPDFQWHDFWESIDIAIENSGTTEIDKEKLAMEVRREYSSQFKTMWECTNCGKLFIDAGGADLVEYSSQSGEYNGVLNPKGVSL